MSDNDLIRRGDALKLVSMGADWWGAHAAIAALPAVRPDPAPDASPCGSDVTDMDGHVVHDDDCPESWQSQATLRKFQMVAPAPDVAGLVQALREAERFMAYFAGETGRSFGGSGTPQTCLASIRAALAAMEARNG